jgi:hypothetical protein
MISEASFIDVALRSWKSNVDRAGAFFGALSTEELQKEIAPGKNRLIYIWGAPCGGQRSHGGNSGIRRETSSGTRRDVCVKSRQDSQADAFPREVEEYMGRGQRKTVDGNFQAIAFGMAGETYGGVRRGFQPRASPKPFRRFAGQDDASRLPPRTSCSPEAGILEGKWAVASLRALTYRSGFDLRLTRITSRNLSTKQSETTVS